MRRSDKENDPSVQTAEWNALISEMYGELWVIVMEAGLEYFETAVQLTTNGTNVLSEQSDHLATVAVCYVANATAGRYVALRELMAQERARMSGVTGAPYASAYALVDDELILYPTPPSGQVYEWRYVPQPTDLSSYADSGVVDLVTPDGEALLIWGVAVKAMHKSESDVTVAIAEREAARSRFLESCQLRALNASRHKVLDIESEGGDVYGWWGW